MICLWKWLKSDKKVFHSSNFRQMIGDRFGNSSNHLESRLYRPAILKLSLQHILSFASIRKTISVTFNLPNGHRRIVGCIRISIILLKIVHNLWSSTNPNQHPSNEVEFSLNETQKFTIFLHICRSIRKIKQIDKEFVIDLFQTHASHALTNTHIT